jgi:hypothetical protein
VTILLAFLDRPGRLVSALRARAYADVAPKVEANRRLFYNVCGGSINQPDSLICSKTLSATLT